MVALNKVYPRVKKISEKNRKSKSKLIKAIEKDCAEQNADVSNKVKVVTQELRFAKVLAGNDTQISKKQLVSLKKWLTIRSNSSFPFEDQDFLRIWKGLFYCMWMSDKPLPQEMLADDLASLVHCFSNQEISIQFFGKFLQTMNFEWFGIDQWRIDKFMMLVRRITRQIFLVLHQADWKMDLINLFTAQIDNTVLSKNATVGFFMHFTELYLEELSKITDGHIATSAVTALINPFSVFVAKQKEYKLSNHVVKHIFNNLLFQSEMGREYKEKFEAWKQMGFPGNSIDDLELVVNEEDNDSDNNSESEEGETLNEKVLDPRAGRVDVVMAELPFDPIEIIKSLEELKFKQFTNVKSRYFLKRIISQYETFASGQFPIGIRNINIDKDRLNMPKIEDKVNELIEFEKKLLGDSKSLKKLSKKKRKKLISLPKTASPKKISNSINSKKRSVNKLINTWKEEDIINSVSNNEAHDRITTSKKRKLETSSENIIKTNNANVDVSSMNDEWSKPLTEGEIEFTVVSPKLKLKSLNKNLNKVLKIDKTVLKKKSQESIVAKPLEPVTPVSIKKKVKIMLKMNRSQDTSEYIQQLRSSPNVPYDSSKKPIKSLLKPNLMQSPINPYYKKKIGLNFDF